MKNYLFGSKIFAASALATALMLSGCGGDSNTNDDYSYANPASPVTNVANVNYTKTQPYAAQSKLISYTMPKITGTGNTTATAVVLVPNGRAPAGGWPIVVWAHGTTGVADKCAPSATANLGGVDTLLANLLINGYVVVAPDYEGLGSDGIHPFLNAESEGNSIIYAVKATKAYVNNTSNNWMVVGHSQGGHAAIAAAERASEAGLNFKGAVAYAPASNLAAILGGGYQTVANAIGTAALVPTAKAVLPGLQTFSAFVAAGIRETRPNFNYSDAFTSPRSIAIAQKAESECISELAGAFAADISSYYETPANTGLYPGLTTAFTRVPEIAEFLEDSNLAMTRVNQPVLIIQGTADTTVPADATRLLESQLKRIGTPVTATYLDGKTHTTVLTEGSSYLLGFLQQNMPAS